VRVLPNPRPATISQLRHSHPEPVEGGSRCPGSAFHDHSSSRLRKSDAQSWSHTAARTAGAQVASTRIIVRISISF
jgi:hypothetical protein